MASDYAYTSVPNSLRQFLKGVPNRGVPNKVDTAQLKSIGLKEANDQSIIRVLKFVGLLNGDGTPTEAYKGFRDKSKGPTLLANEIRGAYKDLFDTYPDAFSQTDDNLRNFFSAKTSVGTKAISFMMGTFKVLCEFGEFSGAPLANANLGSVVLPPPSLGTTGRSGSPSIHINLQVYLPDAADPATYDAIFSAMSRNLGKFL